MNQLPLPRGKEAPSKVAFFTRPLASSYRSIINAESPIQDITYKRRNSAPLFTSDTTGGCLPFAEAKRGQNMRLYMGWAFSVFFFTRL